MLNIVKSWYHYAAGTPFTRNLIEKRIAVCIACPHVKQLNSAAQVLVKLIDADGTTLQCRLCTCPMAAKAANPKNSCPDNPKRWTAVEEDSYF